MNLVLVYEMMNMNQDTILEYEREIIQTMKKMNNRQKS
jgi:hypothetical protein